MSRPKVIFRADGSSTIGLGHVVRSLALAEMLKEDFDCVFAIQKPSVALQQKIRASKVGLLELENSENQVAVKELDAYLSGQEIVVLDGYKFDTKYQRHLKEKGCALVCIDDIHSYHFVADRIINHGLLDSSVYSREPYSKVLLGPRYCLLRKPFLEKRKEKNVVKKDNSVFLCFGGADAHDLTSRYLKRLIKHNAVSSIQVVVGSAYKSLASLKAFIAEETTKPVVLHSNASPEELSAIIQQCKVAIVPGSTISLECASLGITMMVGYYVDNQLDIVHMLDQTGLGENIGNFMTLDDDTFYKGLDALLNKDVSSSAAVREKFFDGRSSERLLKVFHELRDSMLIQVRKARQEDCDLFFQWATDPEVRGNAINTEPIEYQKHCQWFHSKLANTQSFVYICELLDQKLGQVRFDLEEDGAFIIDYSIAKELRGKGLGKLMLCKAIENLKRDYSKGICLRALVKHNNHASVNVFKSLHFDSKGQRNLYGTGYELFEKKIVAS